MAAFNSFSLALLTLTPLFIIFHQAHSQAPAPEAAGPVNLTAILAKNGQYTTFIRFLQTTQVENQIENQINSSTEGLTVFSPTDNAFNNLEAGTLNNLNPQQQVQLVLYHVAPKYYSLSDLLSVPNPVRTQASLGLNFTGHKNQVNVSTGTVETQVNNALRQQFPLAVYQVDKVLLPANLFAAEPPSTTPSPAVNKTPSADGKNKTVGAADELTPPNGSTALSSGFGMLVGLALASMLYL